MIANVKVELPEAVRPAAAAATSPSFLLRFAKWRERLLPRTHITFLLNITMEAYLVPSAVPGSGEART